MTDKDKLVDASGQPLFPEKKVIVIKTPKGSKLHPQLYSDISKVTGCAVLDLPMDSELIMGELAEKEILSLHHAIHAILGLPDETFNEEEIRIIYGALIFLCERTSPGDGSKEVKLLKSLKKYES